MSKKPRTEAEISAENPYLLLGFYKKREELLKGPTYFPWHWFGHTMPSYGTVHSYLLDFLGDYAETYELRMYCRGRPSLGELFRVARDTDSALLKSIYEYCASLADVEYGARMSTGHHVLTYLLRNDDFMKKFDLIMKEKFKQVHGGFHEF